MDIFKIHGQLIEDCRSFTTAGVDIRDQRIRDKIERSLDDGRQWPEPWVSLNPMLASGGTIDELVIGSEFVSPDVAGAGVVVDFTPDRVGDDRVASVQ